MSNFNPQSQLKELLPEAKRKARNAQEVINTNGYQDYLDWVKRYTNNTKPNISGLDSLIQFTTAQLINAGIQFGATYFTAIQNDHAEIERQLLEFSTLNAAEEE